jgi:hypothetical protein
MGNALSPFLANIFMADLETRKADDFAESMDSIRQRYILRYGEEHNRPDARDNEPTRRHNTIKFTHEVEDNEILCFLDKQIKRVFKKLTFNIHRKPTATSRYHPIESHHSIQHKSATFNYMIHRLVTTPLSPDDATTELNDIKTIAKFNGYSEEFVDRIHNKHKKKEPLRNLTTLIPVLKRDDAPTKRHAISFYLAITNKLQRIFRNNQIDLVYSNKGKLKDSLGNPKEKTEMLQRSGIYQVECERCDSVYISQTKRSLKTLFGEHHSSIRLNHSNKSKIARHVLSKINNNQGHSISPQLERARCI